MKKIIFFVVVGYFLSACDPQSDPIFRYQSPYNHNDYEFVKAAHGFIGLHEKRDRQKIKDLVGVDPVHTEWCAAFVNSILKLNNVEGSEAVNDYPLMARSFMFWGIDVWEPRIGDVVVFPRGDAGWKGHVGFYIETRVIDSIDYYVILGGNQKNKVGYELYPAYKAITIRRSAPVPLRRPSQSG